MVSVFAVSVLCLLGAMPGVQADDSAETTLPAVEVVGNSDGEYIAGIATTSTKSERPLRDVPQSIGVVTRKVIDDANMQNIGDAVVYVPGVGMAQGEGNRETPVIRGYSSTGDFFLDGMRDDVQYYRDLYNVEQIDVLKGPNGMLFGRGGVGGLINRVSKEAGWTPVRQASVQVGSNRNQRATLDVGQGVNDRIAVRVNGMYEDSGSYREGVTLARYGINPTITVRAGDATKTTLGLEYFHDERVADRGVSSYDGRPLDVDPSTFFGDPKRSPTHATVGMFNALFEYRLDEAAVVRNRTRYADYDKFYQNVFPGATSDNGTMVSLSAYNNAMQRQNFFNQTDLNFTVATGAVKHSFLTGVEIGRQRTQNYRQTGYFDSVAPDTTRVTVPVKNPRTKLPITFRQSATDADNEGVADIAAFYLQDEIALTPVLTAIAGVRYDSFKVDFRNNRTGAQLRTSDGLVSPRLGLVYKPTEPLSLYASYGMAHQPRAGDQLSSLSATNASLDPEEFENYEIGAKWDVLTNLSLTAAVFRLERTNVAVADPDDPLALILVDGQRVEGVEIGLAGNITKAWSVIGAYTYQDGEIVSDQSATVRKGARLANLPENTFSLWNRYDFSPKWGAGLGIIRKSEVFAATENLATPSSNVVLPSYTRVDGALFFTLSENWHAQINIENLLDEEYFQFAHNNTNITPGSPRAIRAVTTMRF